MTVWCKRIDIDSRNTTLVWESKRYVNFWQWLATAPNEIFMELERTCFLPKQCPLLRSIVQSFIGLCDVYYRILCKAADLNQLPVGEKDICSDSYQKAQLLQMAKLQKTLSHCFTLNWIVKNSWKIVAHIGPTLRVFQLFLQQIQSSMVPYPPDWNMTCHVFKLQPWFDFLLAEMQQNCNFQIAHIKYQGKTGDTRI